jgi:glycosyltransferase involved in cell wall biosynthesis
VLNHHNAETALHRQLAEGATGGEKLIRRSLNLRVQQAEQRMLSTVDQVWVCSDGDRKAIVDEFDPTAEVTVIPNTVDVSAYSEALDHSAAKQVGLAYNRARVLFPAYFAYEPNRTAAQLLVDEIFPLLTTAEPDAELLLAGRSPTRELVAAAQSNPRITVTGAVPSMIPYLAAAGVVVVPLHHGSGTRIKILEAFASGVPVVSTAMGAAGLPVTNGLDITIAESPSALASAVAALWQDPGRASRQAEAALDLVRTELSWERTARLVGRALR